MAALPDIFPREVPPSATSLSRMSGRLLPRIITRPNDPRPLTSLHTDIDVAPRVATRDFRMWRFLSRSMGRAMDYVAWPGLSERWLTWRIHLVLLSGRSQPTGPS